MRRDWSPADVRLMRELADAGQTVAQIGAAVGRTESAVRFRCRRVGIELHRGARRALTPTQELEVVAWWKARLALGNNKSIAVRYGVGVSTITAVLNRARAHQRAAERASRRKFFAQLANAPF